MLTTLQEILLLCHISYLGRHHFNLATLHLLILDRLLLVDLKQLDLPLE